MGKYIQGININGEDYLMEQHPRAKLVINEAETSYIRIASLKMIGSYCYIDFVLRALGRHTGAVDYYCCFWQYDNIADVFKRIVASGTNASPIPPSTNNCLKFYWNRETHVISIVFVNGDWNYTDIFLNGPLQSGGIDLVWSTEEGVSSPKAEWGEELSTTASPKAITVSGTTLVIKDVFEEI